MWIKTLYSDHIFNLQNYKHFWIKSSDIRSDDGGEENYRIYRINFNKALRELKRKEIRGESIPLPSLPGVLDYNRYRYSYKENCTVNYIYLDNEELGSYRSKPVAEIVLSKIYTALEEGNKVFTMPADADIKLDFNFDEEEQED